MDKNKDRKRVVVEEVGSATAEDLKKPVEEIKEKVEELQTLTEEIVDTAEKSAAVEEEIVEVTKIATPIPASTPETVQTKPSVSDFAPPYPQKEGVNPFVILIPGVLLLGALLGGVYFYQNNMNTGSVQTAAPTSLPLATPEPSQAPAATLDVTKYSVEILNGSGIAGEAGKVKALLEEEGFVVESTGNAPTYDYKETVIKAKSGVDQVFLNKLSEVLGQNYVVGESEELPTTSSDEVVVYVGSSKAE